MAEWLDRSMLDEKRYIVCRLPLDKQAVVICLL